MISIIVPIYNSKQYIKRCVDSILSQTYRDFELLLVDDGSTDGTSVLCDELGLSDERVRVIHQTNSGVAIARNHGMRQARGEYVAFIDSDDYVDSNYLEALIVGIKQGADVSFCSAIHEDEDNSILRNIKYTESSVIRIEDYDWNSEIAHFVVWGAMYKKIYLDGLLFDKHYYVGEDTLFWSKYIKKIRKLYYTSETRYHYVIYKESAMHGKFNEKRITEVYAWKEIYNIWKLPSVAIQYCIRIMRVCRKFYSDDEFKKLYLMKMVKEFRHIAKTSIFEMLKIGWHRKAVSFVIFYLFPKVYLEIKARK